MASGMCFKFDASHHTLMVFLVLEATVVFIITRVPLLKLQWRGFKNSSPKLCSVFGRFAEISLQPATMGPWSELVPNRDCVVLKSDSCT